MKPQIHNVKLISRYYSVSDGKNTIFATLFNDDSITLQNIQKSDSFFFKRSKKDMIKAVANLMLKACKIDG
jgi:hypothetical protein